MRTTLISNAVEDEALFILFNMALALTFLLFFTVTFHNI